MLQCGLCGGNVTVFDAGNSNTPEYFELWQCKGCGAHALMHEESDVRPAWIAAPPTRVFTRCLKVYGRDGRRIRAKDERGSCYSWERE